MGVTMSTEIILPKLGFSMNEGVLSEWLVAEGATVKEGEPLFSIESDKSTQEIEAPATGVLKILKPAGETYEVGTVIGELT
jgi:pyruvate/2-oxoglutarate dehydrogenase complex dihydrolipoamide acyltransferase (E2) component